MRKGFRKLPAILRVTSIYTYFRPIYEKDYYFAGEMHDFWELVYVKSGRIGVSEDDNVYSMQAGNIIFHKPMELHKLWCEEKSELLIASFTAEGSGMEDLGKGVFEMTYENEKAFGEMTESIDRILSERHKIFLNLREGVSEAEIHTAANRFEAFLLSLLCNGELTESRQRSQSVKNYRLIIKVINDNIEEELSIDKIAGMCNMGTSNLKKTFRKYGGEGIMKYVTYLKLQRAVKLLNEGLTVAEVSDRLSFSSQNYFSMVFKREMGFPPSKLLIK